MLGEWIAHSHAHQPHASGMMIRRHLTELEDTIQRSHALYGPLGAKFHQQSKTWTMPWGPKLKFRHLERDSDAALYQGHSYSRLYPEEIGSFPHPGPILKLFATLRSAYGVPVGVRATGNPGGAGHQWVKARYITPAPLGFKIIEEKTPTGKIMQRIFIPSRVEDNLALMENDPGYIDRLYMVGNPELVKAWLMGDWDAVAGAFYHHWAPQMIVPSFVPPPTWPRARSFDWGSARPFSVHWWAVADGNPVDIAGKTYWFPRGAIVAYREWYGIDERRLSAGDPNVGLKLTAEEVADGIMRREAAAGEYPPAVNKNQTGMVYGVADPSIWKVDGGPSIAEAMSRYRPAWDKENIWQGVYWRQADNSRINGHDQMHARMLGFDGVPMMYFTDQCVHAIRTIPVLQHDDIKLEDLDTAAEDHAADDCRYFCMSRPMPKEKPPMPRGPKPWTIDWVDQNG